MSTIVDFRLYVSLESIYQYIVDENIITHSDFSRFPNAIESGIPSPGRCVHYYLGWWRFPVHWVYTTQ